MRITNSHKERDREKHTKTNEKWNRRSNRIVIISMFCSIAPSSHAFTCHERFAQCNYRIRSKNWLMHLNFEYVNKNWLTHRPLWFGFTRRLNHRCLYFAIICHRFIIIRWDAVAFSSSKIIHISTISSIMFCVNYFALNKLASDRYASDNLSRKRTDENLSHFCARKSPCYWDKKYAIFK